MEKTAGESDEKKMENIKLLSECCDTQISVSECQLQIIVSAAVLKSWLANAAALGDVAEENK